MVQLRRNPPSPLNRGKRKSGQHEKHSKYNMSCKLYASDHVLPLSLQRAIHFQQSLRLQLPTPLAQVNNARLQMCDRVHSLSLSPPDPSDTSAPTTDQLATPPLSPRKLSAPSLTGSSKRNVEA